MVDDRLKSDGLPITMHTVVHTLGMQDLFLVKIVLTTGMLFLLHK